MKQYSQNEYSQSFKSVYYNTLGNPKIHHPTKEVMRTMISIIMDIYLHVILEEAQDVLITTQKV